MGLYNFQLLLHLLKFDMYMLLLLLVKYRQKTLLVKDLGPEQFLYLPESEVK